jgi:hypothetical protein
MTDYRTMSGAEFKRAVGVDPEKWATAFVQRRLSPVYLLEDVAVWFRDAMEAAVKAAVAPRWDQQYSDEDLEAAAKQAGPEWDKLNKPSE